MQRYVAARLIQRLIIPGLRSWSSSLRDWSGFRQGVSRCRRPSCAVLGIWQAPYVE